MLLLLPATLLCSWAQNIFSLADIDSDGRLDLPEFCVAMWLIEQFQAGGFNLPDELEPNMYPPAKRPAATDDGTPSGSQGGSRRSGGGTTPSGSDGVSGRRSKGSSRTTTPTDLPMLGSSAGGSSGKRKSRRKGGSRVAAIEDATEGEQIDVTQVSGSN